MEETIKTNTGKAKAKKYKATFGIVNPWPGDMSAESEVLARIKRASDENNLCCVMLDNFGHILDDEQAATEQFVDAKTLDFVITTHYETPKILDAFYYHTVWNPPEIPLNLGYYTERVTNNYIMNDDYLIYDAGGMSQHLQSMLLNCPRTIEGASTLVASFPASALIAPKLDNPQMFYCGMNWEKVVSKTNRHEGLFKLLDATNKIKFFGPEVVAAWGGIRPWEGYNCYQRSIPFDGFSILKEINDCGVCLVLSSDIHRRAGAATNRTYEACAAGAVMISDDNPFMLENFKDAALFITYNKNDPEDTFKQIMEKYEWISTHREEALEIAKRAQKIFLEKFSLDKQLNGIVENHPKRFHQIEEDLFAKTEDKNVLVTFVLNTQKPEKAKKLLNIVFENIKNQYYSNIKLAIAADCNISDEVSEYCKTSCPNAEVYSMELFDKKGIRNTTDGQAIRHMQSLNKFDYYVNTTADEIWFKDHITTLVRTIENQDVVCAYSGATFHDINGYRRINFFDVLGTEYTWHITKPERPLAAGQFMFKAQPCGLLPDYLFAELDGFEHMAFYDYLRYREDLKTAFSCRMTMCFTDPFDERSSVVPMAMQKRFVQDIIRLYIPDKFSVCVPETSSVVDTKAFARFMLNIRIKDYIKLRYYQIKLRLLKPGSARHQRCLDRYNDTMTRYLNA